MKEWGLIVYSKNFFIHQLKSLSWINITLKSIGFKSIHWKYFFLFFFYFCKHNCLLPPGNKIEVEARLLAPGVLSQPLPTTQITFTEHLWRATDVLSTHVQAWPRFILPAFLGKRFWHWGSWLLQSYTTSWMQVSGVYAGLSYSGDVTQTAMPHDLIHHVHILAQRWRCQQHLGRDSCFKSMATSSPGNHCSYFRTRSWVIFT